MSLVLTCNDELSSNRKILVISLKESTRLVFLCSTGGCSQVRQLTLGACEIPGAKYSVNTGRCASKDRYRFR
jgi:hypothetical protein